MTRLHRVVAVAANTLSLSLPLASGGWLGGIAVIRYRFERGDFPFPLLQREREPPTALSLPRSYTCPGASRRRSLIRGNSGCNAGIILYTTTRTLRRRRTAALGGRNIDGEMQYSRRTVVRSPARSRGRERERAQER